MKKKLTIRQVKNLINSIKGMHEAMQYIVDDEMLSGAALGMMIAAKTVISNLVDGLEYGLREVEND